ncbi:MAG: YfiR family protein [Bryobacteraceae bacterium]|jgi:uncharacterized protein DUF4154
MMPLVIFLAGYTLSDGSPLAAESAFVPSPSHSEYQIKSAMVYNFARLVKWPAPVPGGTPLTVGVIGDARIVPDLQAALRNKVIDGRPIVVRRLGPADDPKSCPILYLGPLNGKAAARILQATAHAPVLTIGDDPLFARQGGVIAFIRYGRRIRFEINRNAARQAGLQISSQLLQLADLWRQGSAPVGN